MRKNEVLLIYEGVIVNEISYLEGPRIPTGSSVIGEGGRKHWKTLKAERLG